jgi:hypothetical protein
MINQPIRGHIGVSAPDILHTACTHVIVIYRQLDRWHFRRTDKYLPRVVKITSFVCGTSGREERFVTLYMAMHIISAQSGSLLT